MRWPKTSLSTLIHTSIRFQIGCLSLSTEKPFCKSRGLMWPVTFTLSLSYLLCNVRIFFMGEEFPFTGSECENHCYCPIIGSRSAWLQYSPHFLVPCFHTKPAAESTGSKVVGSAPGKILNSPFLAHTLLHDAKHRIHHPRRESRVKAPGSFFNWQFGPAQPALCWIWPNILYTGPPLSLGR